MVCSDIREGTGQISDGLAAHGTNCVRGAPALCVRVEQRCYTIGRRRVEDDWENVPQNHRVSPSSFYRSIALT